MSLDFITIYLESWTHSFFKDLFLGKKEDFAIGFPLSIFSLKMGKMARIKLNIQIVLRKILHEVGHVLEAKGNISSK